MKSIFRYGRVLVVVSALGACAPTINVHGQKPDPDALAAIEPGQTTESEVEQALGTPSTRGVFRGNVWYYMTERTEQSAFFKPELLERQIVAVVFDRSGVVEDIVTYTENDKQEVDLVSRVTPTAGNELSIIQQLFGNVGRFSQ